MILLAAVVALRLVSFHGPDGYAVEINPDQVTTLRASREADQQSKFFTSEVHCMIGLTDGKFVTVSESCEEVRSKLVAPR
ncbi:hypothetical protein HAP48_0002045 [Bradyrhizobium septentrionale]|uniref:Uncharacterized protein n=1 Tax=Bradyrhizobium septentrionale TaxID=1404411 RepID=A0A973W4X0_9BRAD|nr:hypothetical protein [Bradyrhizobium septentrionale]UGY16371.1 hypothetical protein HAP48_0002045 [Bradyrhizobium septentrionale]UGY21503.1 hypothetical protein HU675_0026105 [Bradyrhizobium septentrionale]UGY25015.1 hypothetical protein HU675_0045325 [Bradyrhizobium septentrionale]